MNLRIKWPDRKDYEVYYNIYYLFRLKKLLQHLLIYGMMILHSHTLLKKD